MTNERLVDQLAVGLLARVELFMSEYEEMTSREVGEVGWLGERGDPPPFALHFTSSRVAESALENDVLWLMDATTSNDREERKDGIRVMWQTLDKAWRLTLEEAQSLPIEDTSDFRPAQLDRMGLILRGAILRADHPVGLVLCLSKPEPRRGSIYGDWHPSSFDNLTMWREYGGSDGDGVALGMDLHSLVHPMRRHGCELLSVTYDLSEKERACRFLVVACLELVRERNQRMTWTKSIAGLPSGTKVSLSQAIEASKHAARMLSFLFKHPAFAYERELRLLCCRPSNSVRVYKNSSTMSERYYVTTSDIGYTGKLPIFSVCMGPRASVQSSDRIESLCKSRSVELHHSTIPYRGRDSAMLDLTEFYDMQEQERRVIRSDEFRLRRRFCIQQRDQHWSRIEDQARKWNDEHLPPD